MFRSDPTPSVSFGFNLAIAMTDPMEQLFRSDSTPQLLLDHSNKMFFIDVYDDSVCVLWVWVGGRRWLYRQRLVNRSNKKYFVGFVDRCDEWVGVETSDLENHFLPRERVFRSDPTPSVSVGFNPTIAIRSQ